jgi:hypothetical protein
MDHGFPPDGILAASAMDGPGIAKVTLDPATLETVRAQGQVQNHRRWPHAAEAPLLAPIAP